MFSTSGCMVRLVSSHSAGLSSALIDSPRIAHPIGSTKERTMLDNRVQVALLAHDAGVA